ncbi:Cytochrome c biogenesis protein CcsB [Delftia tsuruhatensis]|uniref:cytochrome c biogenesis protein ResB n=1 Tax=Delftia tsuruhatensis TaxID=180282 RepID=UPI001E7E5D13|nr:cytochrome c biogenesis protein ResB [Delftia tsuruhatensis]CAB5664780.1 Cytochrome c biogenesis protein CcsB [Delftia tsuruhatensis]CAC9677465.1 Cytochrome c biogenesis protein CcsB [Delftia tsuruhatensis]
MSDNSSGAALAPPRPQAVRAVLELLASMRFAISLLTVICIASVIGTVLKQHEPVGNYVNQFGPFWAQLFLALKLNAVYSAWWFLLILAFLVVSTSLCVARHAPKYLADLRSYKENIREQSLKAFGHRASSLVPGSTEEAARRLGQQLASGGWKVRLQQRDTAAGPGTGWMLAAKAGAANKLGYIAAHCAIVLICLGGLFDGDLVVRAQMWLGGKTPYTGGGLISEVPGQHRLSQANPTFRGNLLVTEGGTAGTAILTQSDGVLLQELPFAVELKKFIVEYYSTGMPKLFASEVVIHDKATGEQVEKRIEVNHPASYRGIEIYQSSFDDGGSSVKLQAVPFEAGAKPFEADGVIGGSSEFTRRRPDGKEEALTLEYTQLRVINVENFGAAGAGGPTDVRKVDLRQAIDERLGAAHKTVTKKELRNIGPSIGYKLRDASGQAREFQNYMLPVDTGDGQPVFLLGVRDSQADPMRYLRVPADPEGSMDTFMRLRGALQDPQLREKAARAYVAKAVDASRADLAGPLAQSATKALELFAGQNDKQGPDGKPLGGLQAISDFMEGNVPAAERERAGEVLVRILNGVLFELAQIVRAQAGQASLEPSEQTQSFMTQAVFSLSDAQFYPAPMAFMMQDFKQVQASVFQVARAPGKNVVYLGCLFLIIGVFAMLYVRDRRIWIWLTPRDGASHAEMALSTNRKTLDGDREFAMLAGKLIGAEPIHKKTHGGSA